MAIENILFKEEVKLIEERIRDKFCEYFLNNMLLTDENKYTWSVRYGTTGSEIDMMDIISFSKLTVRRMADFDQKIVRSNMKLYLVYRKFKDLFNDGKISFERADKVQETFLENISDREHEILSEKQAKIMQDEIAVFDRVVGNNPDAVDALMKNCLLVDSDDAIDFVEDIMKFYTKAKEAVSQQF